MSLRKIEETGFSMRPNLAIGTDIVWSLASRMDVNANDNELSLELFATAERTDNRERVAVSSVRVTFNVNELDSYVSKLGNGKVRMKEGLIITCLNASINTLRGVMASQFKGTVLEDNPLPLCDPKTVMENMKIG